MEQINGDNLARDLENKRLFQELGFLKKDSLDDDLSLKNLNK